MFRDLIPRLSDAYRVIAPDYPAFGHVVVNNDRSHNVGVPLIACLYDKKQADPFHKRLDEPNRTDTHVQ
jgi:hypothetical protein